MKRWAGELVAIVELSGSKRGRMKRAEELLRGLDLKNACITGQMNFLGENSEVIHCK
ncbi:hypothetical protein [uncultured Methanomethylovorans sp.]|uniref:hypothetical protein n=1 Tax=uncultured Methanomethylovorans sp. TaxID=183759 RepID=UPI002AA8765D|nr:hypothetical protein [uncultured Methanomethylovorans sp.]